MRFEDLLIVHNTSVAGAAKETDIAGMAQDKQEQEQALPWLHGVLMDLPDLLPIDSTENTWYEWSDDSEKKQEKRNMLQLAASMQAVKCVQWLLENGMDARVASPSDGKTALHLACACRPSMATARVIALLVQHGADRSALDHDGHAPGFALEHMTSKSRSYGTRTIATSASLRSNMTNSKCSGRCCGDMTRVDVKQPISKVRDSTTLMTPISVLEEIDGCDYNGTHFRMFHYKVDMCPHTDCLHDVDGCPYAHPGEKSRRRNPAMFTYQPVPCPHFRKGNCKKGDQCPLSHGVFECWLHPSKYRTQLCTEGSGCSRSLCFFAHSLEELREASDGCQACDMESCAVVSSKSGTSSPSEQSSSSLFFDGSSLNGDEAELLFGEKVAALQANAAEREKARRESAVADAIVALKAFAASRNTTVPYLDCHVSKPNLKNGFKNVDACSVLSIPTSDSCKSLIGSEHAFETW